MQTGQFNARFLAALTPEAKQEILSAIANHYGISTAEAEAELIDDQAEHILDYLTGDLRSSTHCLILLSPQLTSQTDSPDTYEQIEPPSRGLKL